MASGEKLRHGSAPKHHQSPALSLPLAPLQGALDDLIGLSPMSLLCLSVEALACGAMDISSSFSQGIIREPVKGKLGSKLRFCCVHFIKLWCLIEEEITVFGLWAVVGQKPYLLLGCWPK